MSAPTIGRWISGNSPYSIDVTDVFIDDDPEAPEGGFLVTFEIPGDTFEDFQLDPEQWQKLVITNALRPA